MVVQIGWASLAREGISQEPRQSCNFDCQAEEDHTKFLEERHYIVHAQRTIPTEGGSPHLDSNEHGDSTNSGHY
jgi:hypothetical protein